MNIKKLVMIFFLAITFILTSCSGKEVDYVVVSNEGLWAGYVSRPVLVTGTVVAIHHPPSVYSFNDVITVIENEGQLIYLFCMENKFDVGDTLLVKGRQKTILHVKVPNPTGYTDEYAPSICVDEVTLK